MKKYVDYSSLHYSEDHKIKEEKEKITIWKSWLIFFSVMSILSISPMFYFSIESLRLMILVAAYSLLGVIASIVFICMYKRFIKDWGKFNHKANKDWQDIEDEHNEDWNNFFKEWRDSSYYTEDQVMKSEQDVIDSSK